MNNFLASKEKTINLEQLLCDNKQKYMCLKCKHY